MLARDEPSIVLVHGSARQVHHDYRRRGARPSTFELHHACRLTRASRVCSHNFLSTGVTCTCRDLPDGDFSQQSENASRPVERSGCRAPFHLVDSSKNAAVEARARQVSHPSHLFFTTASLLNTISPHSYREVFPLLPFFQSIGLL